MSEKQDVSLKSKNSKTSQSLTTTSHKSGKHSSSLGSNTIINPQSENASSHTSRRNGSKSESTSSEIMLSEVNPLKDIIQFDYSFGYDCQQLFNLCVIDQNTLLFYSGTLIHIFNVKEKNLNFVKSFSGSGIGHIVKNPNEAHIAIGEKCLDPLILIYEWPSFDIVTKMSGGTTRGYSHLGYSPDGTMLVSQGKEPDHLITIWNWKNAQIILRVKSHGQDVFNAEFSQFVPGQLTTGGLGHIKFWKMAKTFTGLKLQGELGRFGRTEICDIMGICALPDEKVVSSSEWGNLLVWEDRLIKLEVRQKAKGNCHSAAISQIHYNPVTQDIISVGMDGWVKVWTRATIDAADPPDEEEWYLEMQPVLEVEVKDQFGKAKLMSISKSIPEDHEDTSWFAQDGNGGIWSLSLSEDATAPVKLLTCHSGKIAAIAASPLGKYLASISNNGCLLIHDVLNRTLLITKQFKSSATALVWMPLHVEASGAVLVGGFADGMLRVFVANIRELEKARRSSSTISSSNEKLEYLNIIQKVKVHSAPITAVSLNPRGSILVTGSEDKTVFVHQILPKREYIGLSPIGFLQLMAPISYITWRPKVNTTALVACADGFIVQVVLPERTTSYTQSTYELSLDYDLLKIKSVKSELIRAQEIREIDEKKRVKLEMKKSQSAKIKTENPNLDLNEELFLMDSDEEIEFPPLYFPEHPSPILFIIPQPDGNLSVSLGGYDCGFLYQYAFGVSGPVRSDPVPNALDIPIHSFQFVCGGELLVLGLANGVIRLVHWSIDGPDLNDYYDLALHDPEHGFITQLCVSNDGQLLYSCGTDGNVFSYQLNPDFLDNESLSSKPDRRSRLMSTVISGSIPKEIVEDQNAEEEPSLEQTKRDAEKLHQQKLSNEHKESVRRKIASLRARFEIILERNQLLPESQILSQSVFEIDPRITEALQIKIDADMNLLMCKLAFKVAKAHFLVKKMQDHFVNKIASLDVTVRAIKNEDLRIKAFTHNKLTPEFLQAEIYLQTILDLRSCISRFTFDLSSRGMGSTITLGRHSEFESMQKLALFYHKMTLKAKKAVIKYNTMKLKRDRREQQWAMFLETKPNINEDDPEDTKAFENAVNNIGDFKLKCSNTYRVPEDKRITPAQKYWQLVQLHREIFETKEAFNKKVCEIRHSKIKLVRRFKQLYHDLDLIQEELSPELIKKRLPIPVCYLKNNFPEHIFRLEFGADPTIYQPISAPYDEEYHILKINKKQVLSTNLNEVSIEMIKWKENTPYEELQHADYDDDEDTSWEHERKWMRMIRNLYEQDCIIKEMKQSTELFDVKLENLSIDRLKYARDIKLMELFQLTLHQELIVIDSYSGQEDEITQRINDAVQVRNDKMRHRAIIQDLADTKQQDISLWQMKLTDIQEEMAESLLNNKFAKYLNRIFKKKRVIRHSTESESESSSSEETTDEDFEDEENEDYIPIKLDENVCPEGCDFEIYQNTIHCRNLRYDIEDNITEVRKQLDEHQRDLQICNKDLAKLENEVQKTNQELEAVQFEKQQKLNEIETVVVLNLSQFRHFVTASRPEEGLVQNPLVFHSEVLLTLAGRIRELQKETEAEEIKIRQQKALKLRLSKRCKEMKEIKKNIKKEIDEEIMSKFGELIDVDLMEETVMKRMVNQARRDYLVEKLRKNYDKIIADLNSKLWQKRDYLVQVQNENTRKLKLQTMLEHETMELNELLRQQFVSKESTISFFDENKCEEEVKLLENILKNQLTLKEDLQKEIKILSYKCTPPDESKTQKNVFEKINSDSLRTHEHTKQSGTTMEEEENTQSNSTLEEKSLEQPESKNVETIDKILEKLASGFSAYEIATSLVEELLRFSSDEIKRSSAVECAMKLVEELIIITTQDETGDLLLVEHYADELQRLSQTDTDELQRLSQTDTGGNTTELEKKT